MKREIESLPVDGSIALLFSLLIWSVAAGTVATKEESRGVEVAISAIHGFAATLGLIWLIVGAVYIFPLNPTFDDPSLATHCNWGIYTVAYYNIVINLIACSILAVSFLCFCGCRCKLACIFKKFKKRTLRLRASPKH